MVSSRCRTSSFGYYRRRGPNSSITVASISPTAPVSVHDHHWDFSIEDNSTAGMAESSLSSRIIFGRHSPAVGPSTLVVEGDIPSASSGKAPSSSPEVQTGDLECMEKLRAYLDIAAECLVHVQEMPSRKFNDEQCGYLVDKLKWSLQLAEAFLGRLFRLPMLILQSIEDITRCIEVFKLFLALALEIESFIQGCCREDWLQAAMTLTNSSEYVSSLGFNLRLCGAYFSPVFGLLIPFPGRLTSSAAEVARIEREEVEMVREKASLDVDVLLHKVISEFRSLPDEERDLPRCVLQRLDRVVPVSMYLSPDSPVVNAFSDWVFMDRIFRMVQGTELLGKGTSATVHKALWFGIPVAKKTFYGPEHPDYLNEAETLGGLSHPNIMSMFCCAMDRRKCSIVMELMDEDLHSFMERRLDANPDSPPFSVFEAVDVILQIGEGVRYLHENRIVHRDLKSFNVLVKNILPPDLEVQYVLIKVADFGFAKIKERSTRFSNLSFNIGTIRWMAPEVINFCTNNGQTSTSVLDEGPKYPKKSDVYSFGMVCYEVLTGDVPFPHETSHAEIKKMVLEGERPTLPDYCPSVLKVLIEACWDPEPTERPSFATICSSVKHLKYLLMSGFKFDKKSGVEFGESLRIARENSPFDTLTREIGVRRRSAQEGLHEGQIKRLRALDAFATWISPRHGF